MRTRVSHSACRIALLVVIAGCGAADADTQYWLDDMPEYSWYRGCSPTSGGHLIGYWDNRPGYEDLYDGTAPMAAPQTHSFYQTIASDEHAAAPYSSDACTHGNAPNSLACFMHTTPDTGGSHDWNIASGMRGYAAWDDPDTAINESHDFTSFLYYASSTSWEDSWRDALFNFSDLRHQIDHGNPLLLNLSLVGGGHTVTAYGYWIDDAGDLWFAVRDTWMDGTTSGTYGVRARSSNGQEWWRFTIQEPGQSFGSAYFISSAVPFIPNEDGAIREEADFANGWQDALTINSSAETIYAGLGDGDEDWFRVWLHAGQRAVVTTQDYEGYKDAIDTEIWLRDTSGTLWLTDDDVTGITNTSNLSWRADQTGWYCFGVLGGGNAGVPQTGDYALTYFHSEAPEPGTVLLLSIGLAGILVRFRRDSRRRGE